MGFFAKKLVNDYDISPELKINFDQKMCSSWRIHPWIEWIKTNPDEWSKRQATGESLFMYLLLKEK